MFTARGLIAAEAHLAYPLVSCRYPSLSLALWTNYVRDAEHESAREKLLCLIDRRDRRHAILAYGVDRSQPERARLRIAQVNGFQLSILATGGDISETTTPDGTTRMIRIDPGNGEPPILVTITKN